MQKNLFIAFEGIDGSGKSTQVKLLADKLEALGHQVYSTFEPTKSDIGKMIRTIFSGKMEADHKVIAALFAADRLDHLLNKTDGILTFSSTQIPIFLVVILLSGNNSLVASNIFLAIMIFSFEYNLFLEGI